MIGPIGSVSALVLPAAAFETADIADQLLDEAELPALADEVRGALRVGDDPGAPALLDAYRRARRRDQALVSAATDVLVGLFSNRLPGLGLARAAGLVAFDLLGPAKRAFARQAMGIAGPQSRLTRGLGA